MSAILEVFRHPLDPNEKVVGTRVVVGQTGFIGDRYDAPTKKWDFLPYEMCGKTVTNDSEVIIVRPGY